MVNASAFLAGASAGIERRCMLASFFDADPEVVGFRLHGKLREGATATDLFSPSPKCCAKRRSRQFRRILRNRGSSTAAFPIAPPRQYGTRVRARPWASFPLTPETLAYPIHRPRPTNKSR